MTFNKKQQALRTVARKNGKYVMNKLFDDFVTGPISKKLVPSCIICGAESGITKEHVLPKWAFESNPHIFFISIVNELRQAYIKSTVPACQRCNSDLLNSLERYIQATFSEINLTDRFYTAEQLENIVRWLEVIDFKFQVFEIATKFRAHKRGGYIADLSDFSIAFMREMSVRAVQSKCRLALKRVTTKRKTSRINSLVIGRTIEKTSHYFHRSGEFIYLEVPAFNRMFFYFFEKEFKTNKRAQKEAIKIINSVYGDNPVSS